MRPLICLVCVVLTACASQPKPAAVASTAAKASAPSSALPLPRTSELLATPESFERSCADALRSAEAAIARVKADPLDTRPAVLVAYDEAVSALTNAADRASIASNAHPNPAVRDAAAKCQQSTTSRLTQLSLDRGVYDALSRVDLATQDATTKRWVEKTLRDFRRAGVDKDAATRAKVQALNDELTYLSQQFGQHIREDVRTLKLPASQLKGLPEDYVRAHPAGPDGQVSITTDTPDYAPFMTYAQSSRAREALWRLYRARAPQNEETLKTLLKKRHELATLLGYRDWAAYATEDKMIGSEGAAEAFIDQLERASRARAQTEYAQLLAQKRKEDPKATSIDPWDQDYLEDQIRAAQYGYDSRAARPYFEFSRVKQGVLDVTSRLFHIQFKHVTDAVVWHPDVDVYDLYDGDRLLGRAYLDLHPRADKYKHAAEYTLTVGEAGKRYPEAVLLTNFPQPGKEAALMPHEDVETFFHEFGHLLHDILGGSQKWAQLSGAATEWDFVEAPSMLLQQWASDPAVLATFARHYQTGEQIPADLVKRMTAASEFGKGVWTRRQIFLSALSLELHRQPDAEPLALMEKLQARFLPFRREYVPGTAFYHVFGHLDEYSAVYYTYLWSSVIAQDLRTVFRSEGMLNPAPALRYRRAILDQGGSKDAASLVKDFLGRPYGFTAYEHWLNAG